MENEQIIYLPTGTLIPYKNNARKNGEAVDAVAASIKAFGFRSPIIIDEKNVIICGHTRHKAAQKLGMENVPCIRVSDLSEEEIKKYRLIDNKAGELAKWDAGKLKDELQEMKFDGLDFNFNFNPDIKVQKPWKEKIIRCNLKEMAIMRKASGAYYHSSFQSGGDEGDALEDVKCPDNVMMFADIASEQIKAELGNVDGWAIITTPRRRHKDGFHFATAVCNELSGMLNIPFYPNAVVCDNRRRLAPELRIVNRPTERMLILYDDIITTGFTLNAVRDLFVNDHTVFCFVSIDNH